MGSRCAHVVFIECYFDFRRCCWRKFAVHILSRSFESRVAVCSALVHTNECKQGSVIAIPPEASSHSCDAYYAAACFEMQDM